MVCPSCGRENPDDAAKCSYCGADLNANQTPPTPPTPPYQELPVGVSGPGEQWWNSLWFSIILGVAGLIFCCPIFPIIGIILYWMNPVAPQTNKIIYSVIVGIILLLSIVFFGAFLLGVMNAIRTGGQPGGPGMPGGFPRP